MNMFHMQQNISTCEKNSLIKRSILHVSLQSIHLVSIMFYAHSNKSRHQHRLRHYLNQRNWCSNRAHFSCRIAAGVRITISWKASLMLRRSRPTRFLLITTMHFSTKASDAIINHWPNNSFRTDLTLIHMENSAYRSSLPCSSIVPGPYEVLLLDRADLTQRHIHWSHWNPYQDCIEYRKIQMKLFINRHSDSLIHQMALCHYSTTSSNRLDDPNESQTESPRNPLYFRFEASRWAPCAHLHSFSIVLHWRWKVIAGGISEGWAENSRVYVNVHK